jgi:hypothetical protein
LNIESPVTRKLPDFFLDDSRKIKALAPTQGSQAHSLAFSAEGVVLEKCSWELGATLESKRIPGYLYEPLHNFEMPASMSQRSPDTLRASWA